MPEGILRLIKVNLNFGERVITAGGIMLTKVPKSVVVYMSVDPDVLDKYVVIYPDGAVYRMSNHPADGIFVYDGPFSRYQPSDTELVVSRVPPSVAKYISRYLP